jgi:uroporphyrinogen decarboxylase
MQIREDILNPKQRLLNFLTGKPLDRILCMPIVTANAAHLIGKTTKDFQLDGKVMAEAHIAGFNKFNYDLVYLFTNCSYIAEAMGAPLEYLEDEPANCEFPIIKSSEDLPNIKIAEKNDGKFPVFYEAVDILNKEIGDKVFISVCFSGPVSTAATLRGTEAFARDAYANPELCHKLLRMATDSCINFMKEIISMGAIPIILEPVASGSIFSPKMFKQFAFPYNKELVDFAHFKGSAVALHICGKTHKIVDMMTDTGADIISIDKCDLKIAREKVAGRAVILGNIDPANELLFGPAERIEEVCREALEVMKDYTPGFVLATGCETSNKVPFENIQTMMDAARSHGLYEYSEGV